MKTLVTTVSSAFSLVYLAVAIFFNLKDPHYWLHDISYTIASTDSINVKTVLTTFYIDAFLFYSAGAK